MFVLDNWTILISQLVVGFIISLFTLLTINRNTGKKLYILQLANISYFLGFLLLGFQTYFNRFWGVIFANQLILLSFILFSLMMLELYNCAIRRYLFPVIQSLNLIFFIYFLYFNESTFFRIITISLNIILVLFITLFTIRNSIKNRVLSLLYLCSTFFYIGILLYRCFITTLTHIDIDSIFSIDIATSVSMYGALIYHLSINIIVFIGLLDISEDKLHQKVLLIKQIYQDIEEISSFKPEKYGGYDSTELYSRIARFIHDRFKADGIIIYRLVEKRSSLEAVASYNLTPELLKSAGYLWIDNNFITGKAVLENRPQMIDLNDYTEGYLKELIQAEGYQVLASYPIQSYKGVIGAVGIGLKERTSLILDDSAFFSLVCNQLGTILENSSLYEDLEARATTDQLTGVCNRREFQNVFQLAFNRYRRVHNDVALIFIDIDHFKQVNDQIGHNAGDKVLIHVVDRIESSLRDMDVLARYGGEEFVLLMENSDEEKAFLLAERIRTLVEVDSCDLGKESINVTISLGISCLLPEDEKLEDVLERADAALYAAKRTGRNRSVIYTSDL